MEPKEKHMARLTIIWGITVAIVATQSSAIAEGIRYLADEADLPRLAKQYGMDDDALKRLRRAHHSLEKHQAKPKPDPIKTNGPVFEDWEKPDAAILFTGEQIGYLEPCGCAGLENQKGGLKRRHTLVKTLRDEWGWPLALLDSGEQVRYVGPQAEIKYRQTIESLIEIGYHAVGLGPLDLRTDLLGLAINLDEEANPLLSANIGVLDFDSGFTRRLRIIDLGKDEQRVRIAVTHVLGDKARAKLAPSDDLIVLTAEEALDEVLPELLAAKADQNVLMVYGNREEAAILAKKFDSFDWVVAGAGSDEPPYQPQRIEGTTRGGGAMLVEVGHKGMYAVVVGLYKNKDNGVRAESSSTRSPTAAPGDNWNARYQKVPLDHRWTESPEMHERLVAYQDELETLGWDGLGVRPTPHPTGRDFAGSAVCEDCHSAAWEVFEKTTHYHTTETLVALSPARHFDPECISCHVVGWEAQKYFPFASGWKSYRETPEMSGQGCENCHGPAARHAAVEYGDIEVEEEEEIALQQALHLEIVENEGNMSGQVLGEAVKNCLQCHDLDNSPDFDFQKYWPEVAHEGLD